MASYRIFIASYKKRIDSYIDLGILYLLHFSRKASEPHWISLRSAKWFAYWPTPKGIVGGFHISEELGGVFMFLKKALKGALMATVAAGPLVGFSGTVGAQTVGASSSRVLDEIVVTARKREESIQDVPVAVQAFNSETLEAYATSSFSDLNDLVSSLTIYADGPTQPSVNLRGIQGNAINATGDDSISTNIDGIQHSNSQIFRFGLFEVEAVEVLKGPQALFFGKNSPGGIVSLRTKNPTDEFYSEFQAGHEFNGDRIYGHGVLSGPLTDNWGARIGVRGATQDGYFENIWGDGDPTETQPFDDTGPDYDEGMIIGTLRGEYDRATLSLKGIYAHREGNDYNQVQIISLNGSTSNPFSDGTLDDRYSAAPFFDTTDSRFGRDAPELKYQLAQISLDASYRFTDNWSIHSLTGWIDINNFNFGNVGAREDSTSHGLALGQDTTVESISQELRISGDYDRVRLMAGAFYDDRETEFGANVWIAPTFRLRPDATASVTGESWSVFGQVQVDVLDSLEVSLGGRYTEEDRGTSGENLETFGPRPAGPHIFAVDELSYTNFSPEVTISWDATEDLTFFANYKEGFKSGGFNASTLERSGSTVPGAPPIEDAFNEELVEGFEVGMKSEWFGNSLRVNVTGFWYDYTDLQQSSFFTDSTGAVVVKTVNAAEAKIRGVEGDLLWATPLEGLSVTGNLAYNKNEFEEFIQECNEFQLWFDAAGCNIDIDNDPTTWADDNNPNVLVAGTGFEAQDRSGTPLRRAPKWSGSAGLSFERPMVNNLLFSAAGLVSFSSKYQANGENNPQGIQKAYATLNANFGIGSENGGWQFEVIGRNLTDEAFLTSAFDNSRSADTAGGNAITAQHLAGIRNAPRQVFVQFTMRPQEFFR